MSTPPPSTASREFVLSLEAARSWARRRSAGALTLGPLGAAIDHPRLRAPLRLPLGTLALGLVERGAARPAGEAGRFPVLRRLSDTAVLPAEHGIEGWLWTTESGSALPTLSDEDDAPNAALLFTKPVGSAVLSEAFDERLLAWVAERSPLGDPSAPGLLLRVAEPADAETVFRRFGLVRPLTDREVPPTMRRHLPTDRPADGLVEATGAGPAAASVPPPGLR